MLDPDPDGEFDVSSAVFVPQDPFQTFGVGVEPQENGQLRIGAASLTADVEGDRVIGTFSVRTSGSFNALTSAHIEVVFLSLGPSSTARDSYDGEDLKLGVVVNQ